MERLEQRTLLSVAWAGSEADPGAGQWLDFDPADGVGPGAGFIELQQGDGTGVRGRVVAPGVWVRRMDWSGEAFAQLELPGGGTTQEAGAPALPVIRQLVSVPSGASVTAQVLGEGRVFSLEMIGIAEPVVPAAAATVKRGDAGEAAAWMDGQAYGRDAFAPQPRFRMVEAGGGGEDRQVLIEVYPVLYNPVRGEIEAYPDLQLDLRFSKGSGAGGTLLRESGGVALEAATVEGGADRLLVIADDGLAGVASLGRYAEFKRERGWAVEIAPISVAGNTAEAIGAFIKGRYANEMTRPSAVLLVGDVEQVPAWEGRTSYKPFTDLYYGTMDGGDDWQPEFPVGRFSVTNESQLDVVVGKTLVYEQAATAPWMFRAAFAAGIDQHEITEKTHNTVIAEYMDALGYASDRLFEYSRGATTAMVSAAFNEGRGIGVYSGHGDVTAWADGPAFGPNDVNALADTGMYPLVASLACITGAYGAPESFAETWQRAAGGAVAVIAASEDTYWTQDDIFENRLFQAIFEGRRYGFGEALVEAKRLFLEHYGTGEMTRLYYEMYNLFGDPTAQLAGRELTIVSGPELPAVFAGEAANVRVMAAAGEPAYRWSVASGSLPEGLALSESGVISGMASRAGAWDFTLRVEDAVGASASQQFRLVVVARLEVLTEAALPPVAVGEPYAVDLEARGGTGRYRWMPGEAGDYEPETPQASWFGGGVEKGWQGDDRTWRLELPWAFSFYGQRYSAVHVSSNGLLDFKVADSEWSNTDDALKRNVRIAPLWIDLVEESTGEGIFVTEGSDAVVVRWAGRVRDLWRNGQRVDVEAVLHRDGDVEFHYGGDYSGLGATVGVSAGDGVHYTLLDLSGAGGTAARRLGYRPALPAGLTLDDMTGRLTGVPETAGDYAIRLRVDDEGPPAQSVERTFQLTVSTLPPLGLSITPVLGEAAGARIGSGLVRINVAATEDLAVALTSDDPEWLSLPGSVMIRAGETSAAFDVAVIDDANLESSRWVKIIARAAGFVDAAASVRVLDDETAGLMVSLPESVKEGDGALHGVGVLTVSTAPSVDVKVRLTSSDVLELAVADVVIPAGQTSVLFDVTVVDDGVIDGESPVEVRAEVEGWLSGWASLRVLDTDAEMTVRFSRFVTEGEGRVAGAGMVSLAGMAASDIVLSLWSEDETEARVAKTVTIAAGSSSATFDVTVVDDRERDGQQAVAVWAELGASRSSGSLMVRDNELDHFRFGPVGAEQTSGRSFEVMIEASAVDDLPIANYSGTANLRAEGGFADLSLVGTGAATFSGGMWTGEVAINGVDGRAWLEADDGSALGRSGEFAVLAGVELATAESLPAAAVGRPYRVTLEATGGQGPYRWSAPGRGDFVEERVGPQWLGGGTAMNWRGDDVCWPLSLPWAFSFYQQSYTTVNVCSNGYLDFTSSAPSWGNSVETLKPATRIAALWDDLKTDGPGDDIFVTQGEEFVAVRWSARTYDALGQGHPANFEVVLYRDGDIAINYGENTGDLTATSGLSAGDWVHYTLASVNGLPSIEAGTSLRFRYEAPLPAGLSLDESTGVLTGTMPEPGDYAIAIEVSDSSVPPQSARGTYHLKVSPLAQIEGTEDSDRIEVLVGQSAPQVRVYVNDPLRAGAPRFEGSVEGTGLELLGGGGDDAFIVRLEDGLSLPEQGLIIDGGSGENALSVVGTGELTFVPGKKGAGEGRLGVAGHFASLSGFDSAKAMETWGFERVWMVVPGGEGRVEVDGTQAGVVRMASTTGAFAAMEAHGAVEAGVDARLDESGVEDDEILLVGGAAEAMAVRVWAGAGDNRVRLAGGRARLVDGASAGGSLSAMVEAGQLELAGGLALRRLMVAGAGEARLAASGGLVRVGELSVDMARSARLDVTDGGIILRTTTGGAPVDQITLLVQGGRSGGTWDGPGIGSALGAGGDGTHAIGLRLVQADGGSFRNRPLRAGDLLLAWTAIGDADVNGTVDSDDYFYIDRGFLRRETGWANGDFDYSGVIDGDDFLEIDRGHRAGG